jgi:flagellar biosynthesis protein
MIGYTPGSLAVALAYESPDAPRVVAKGDGELGRRIIETAEANGVPIEHNAALAAALSSVELDDEIPVELYRAAAEVIAFVLRMSRKR